VRASAALGVAMALAEAADPGELGAWQRLARLRPGSRLAFDGCLHAAIRARDGVEVRALFAAERPDDVVALGEALEQAGDLAGAADAARARASKGDGLGDALPALLASEIVLARVGDWAGVFNALTRRGEITCDENVASEVDLRRRWILKEKLAGTDEAWNLYRRLHDEVPEDREVTETLARIAAARGETALSIRYLTDLLRGQRDAAECARIQYRVGVAWSAAGNTTAARQAWLDALDHQQDHWESLGALKALADAEGDKAGRIAVLRREALLVDGPDRVARLHDIARAEADGAETGVALDAWRAVLDVVLDDVTALREVLRLSELAGDRASIVTHGEALGRALPPGSERASWFRKAASIAAEQHAQADALRLFELALDADPSDGESALKLEESYRARGDQASVARVLEIATQHVSGEHRKDVLHRRARFELDARMDREATARFYRAILEIDGRDEVALRFLSGHLYDTGRFDLALSIYESLEASMGSAEPDDFDARMELTQYLYRHGDLLRRAGRVDEALQRFERVLHLNSGHIATLEAVAPIYVERQDLQGAERTYRQLLQLSGGRGERAKIAGFYTQLGLVERRLGHVDKALKRFEKAVDVFPSYSPALKGLALVHEDRGDWSNALTVYNAIIGGAARSPEEVVDAYMTKGRLLDERMSRPDKAQQHYERCLEYEGNQPAAYLRLAELAMRRDEYAQAGQLCETALHLADAAAVARLRPLLLLGVAAGLSDGSNEGQARIAVDEALALDPTLAEGLADPPLSDLERLRLALRSRLTAGV
jgi:tetratricopeptide (TPR) repeat protein